MNSESSLGAVLCSFYKLKKHLYLRKTCFYYSCYRLE